MVQKPQVNQDGMKELVKIDQQFEEQTKNIRSLNLDTLNSAPRKELEPQTKLSQNQIANSKEIYLKPFRSIGSQEKFNENYRKEYEFMKEMVHFIAENKMIIGEIIEMWTKPFAGLPAEEWRVPVNKPVWGPRYLAEQIKRAKYHVLSMNEQGNQSNYAGRDALGQYYGQFIAESTVQRLDAVPVNNQKSIFMSA